ncbi:MAG: hypothetical protein Fues2KO_46850 [Fuerstiella sp.]
MKTRTHWNHAFLIFALIVIAAGILLPLVRVQPESVHDYFTGLQDWLRISFAFAMCVVFTAAMFKLLTPRVGQLGHWRAYPPAWLAAVLAWIVVAVVDVFGGFDSDGYRATVREWIGYGGGSLLLVCWYSGLWSELVQWFRRKPVEEIEEPECITLQDIENAPWEEIEAWLESDEPARYDFLGHQSVAHRVSFRITEGIRSVGIVGPYGAGKTSIVSWVIKRLKKHSVGGRRFFVCHHSCWGFETSASAIHDMLGSAVSKLSEEIDTFQVDSLPESYRQTFSAGGDWVETISNLVLTAPDPIEQFSRLSDLLGDIGGRLVFIVEDLDRNETRNFEIQEVLAFLERLKEHCSFSFVLTGGLSSSQHIDYAKLCDHIEFLRTIQPQHSSELIARVSQRCLDNDVFQHVRLGDPNRNYEWNPLSGLLMQDYEEFSLPQAVASLLNTPRSLRHALGRTFSAWHTLHGEIDFNHLLAVNVLRFGAPECFQFLLRHWDRIHSPPSQRPAFGEESKRVIRRAILNDWNHTVENVDWNPTAALRVIEFILPATEYWLVDDSRYGHNQTGPQYVFEERYWIRAINEAIDGDDVRDQEVIRDVQAWLDTPGTATDLVTKLTTSPRYADIWEHFASGLFASRQDEILLLCEQTIQRILSEQGVAACHNSQGFVHTWRFACQRISYQAENVTWLRDRISEAALVSIEMVNALWHYYGSHRQHSIIRPDDTESVRRHILDRISDCVTDGTSLVAKLTPNASSTLYQLVFDPGENDERSLADAQSWAWLGRHILAELRNRNVVAAANCGVLLSGQDRMTVNTEALDQFFGEDAAEVIDTLDSMVEQIPEAYQLLVSNVVGAARQHLAGEISPEEK